MQDVHEPTASGERGPVSPVKAFLILGGILLATMVAVLLTRSDAPQAEPTTTTSNVPTEAEAIAIFNDLHELYRRSYTERDVTLIPSYASPTSPTLANTEEIATLKADGVLDRSKFTTVSLRMVSGTADRLLIEQSLLLNRRFLDEETGEDLTVGDAKERQTVLWTILDVDGTWKLHRRVVTRVHST